MTDKSKTIYKAPYGYCPKCGAAGYSRERRPDGNDRCPNDHMYPSKDAVTSITDRPAPTPSATELAAVAEVVRLTAELERAKVEIARLSVDKKSIPMIETEAARLKRDRASLFALLQTLMGGLDPALFTGCANFDEVLAAKDLLDAHLMRHCKDIAGVSPDLVLSRVLNSILMDAKVEAAQERGRDE